MRLLTKTFTFSLSDKISKLQILVNKIKTKSITSNYNWKQFEKTDDKRQKNKINNLMASNTNLKISKILYVKFYLAQLTSNRKRTIIITTLPLTLGRTLVNYVYTIILK